MDHNKLFDIIQWSYENPHINGVNDCNLTVLKIIDLIAGTSVSVREYSTVKEGIASLKKDGWNHTGEIVEHYCDVVEYPIDGDIWLDPDNPLIMAVVISDRILGVNESHDGFELQKLPTDGKYYRVRKQNGEIITFECF